MQARFERPGAPNSRWARRLLAAALTVVVGPLGCTRLQAAPPAATKPAATNVQTSEFRAMADCIEMSQGRTSVVIVPAWAGRVGKLDFGAGNLVLNNPKVDGQILKPEIGWGLWDGNATDLVQRADGKTKNQWKGLWLHPYPTVRRSDGVVELQSVASDEARLQVTKRYELLDGGRALRYDCRIKSTADAPANWTVWERLLVPGEPGSYAICPVKSGEAYQDGYIVRDNTKVEPPEHVTRKGDYLVIKPGLKQGAGLAAQLERNWMASINGRRVLLMTYRTGSARTQYPHYDGANAIFWIAPDAIELEPLSAEVTLQPGHSFTFTQVWYGLEMPAEIDPADYKAVGQWLDRQAAERPIPGP